MKDNIKLVCFDLNKTLIKENSWLDLNVAMGMLKEEDELLLKWYEESVISYKQWQEIIQNIYKKRGKAKLETISKVLSNYTYLDGAKDIVDYLQSKGYHLALISGSIDILVDKVAKDLQIELFEANNVFVFDSDNYLESINFFDDEKLAKVRHLQSFCRKLDLDITECACIGDGDNDSEIFIHSKHGITFKDSKITNISWKTIDNLLDIKSIL